MCIRRRVLLPFCDSPTGIMNHEAILTVLPDSKEEAISLKQIAQAMGLKISSYTDQISVQRRLVEKGKEGLHIVCTYNRVERTSPSGKSSDRYIIFNRY